jgi:hypothetical protein
VGRQTRSVAPRRRGALRPPRGDPRRTRSYDSGARRRESGGPVRGPGRHGAQRGPACSFQGTARVRAGPAGARQIRRVFSVEAVAPGRRGLGVRYPARLAPLRGPAGARAPRCRRQRRPRRSVRVSRAERAREDDDRADARDAYRADLGLGDGRRDPASAGERGCRNAVTSWCGPVFGPAPRGGCRSSGLPGWAGAGRRAVLMRGGRWRRRAWRRPGPGRWAGGRWGGWPAAARSPGTRRGRGAR